MIERLVDVDRLPIADPAFRTRCRERFDRTGALVLERFLTDEATAAIAAEAAGLRPLAYFTAQHHNVYLDEPDTDLPDDDARSRVIVSTKGAVTTDQLPPGSPLRALYDAPEVRSFLCHVLGADELFPYEDPLSSINLNYYEPGQELGWHFDNSSFSVTLLVQQAEAGGRFEFVDHLRDVEAGDQNVHGVTRVLDGLADPERLDIGAGDLVVFRGRNALHRVTPVEGDRARILAVLAYNTEPGLSLSPTARQTFFGRLD